MNGILFFFVQKVNKSAKEKITVPLLLFTLFYSSSANLSMSIIINQTHPDVLLFKVFLPTSISYREIKTLLAQKKRTQFMMIEILFIFCTKFPKVTFSNCEQKLIPTCCTQSHGHARYIQTDSDQIFRAHFSSQAPFSDVPRLKYFFFISSAVNKNDDDVGACLMKCSTCSLRHFLLNQT